MAITRLFVMRTRQWCRQSLWLLGILSLTSLLAYAQTGTGNIAGRVINKASGEYLRNAQVSVAGTNITTTATAGGFYRLNNVPAGEVRLVVSYTGLDTTESAVSVPAGQTVNHDVTLTSASYDDSKVVLGEFVVSSVREGNARAIMDQRVAVNPKKVISADAMGNVSEGNVGEFLKLMPGVAMDYVEADTRAMRVRGLNPKYATVLFDGMQPASAGSSNVGTGRAFEFEQLSISSIETVELSKSPTPDQPSSVAGVVNLRSKSAFDRQGRQFSFRAGLSGNSYFLDFDKTAGWDDERHYKILPNYELEYSDVYLDNRLGVIAGISSSYTLAAQKHIWNFGPTWNSAIGDNDFEVPVINRWWFQDGPKPTKRGNYNVRIDYRPTDNWTLFGRVDFTTYDARFYNRTMNLFATTYAPGATHTDMTVTSGRIQTDSNQFMTKEGDTLMLTGGSTFRTGDFTADFTAHYSRAKNWYDNLEYGHFTDFATQLTGISWRMTRPDRGSTDIDFTQLSGPNWRDPANYTFVPNSIGWHERDAKDQQWTFRMDFRNDFSRAALPQVIKYGLATNLKVLDVRRYGLLTASASAALRPQDFVDTDFRADWGVNTNMNDWFAISPWKLYERSVTNPADFTFNTAANDLNRLRNNWDFKERISSAYISDTFKFGSLSIAPGLRYEETDGSGKGINVVTNRFMTGGNDYSNTLKYLQATYDLNDNLVLRASYHTAVTRADIANLIPGITAVNDTDRVVTGANPDLRAEKSKSFNASVEYYFEPVGLISVSGFHTSIKDRQFANRTRLGPDGYEGDAQYANYELLAPINIPYETDYSGFEIDYQQQLSFLPGVLRGLGVFANHTRVKFDDWAFNTGSPEVMTNGGVSFTLGRFFGRVNLNHVGKLLQNAQRTYSAATNMWTYAGAAAGTTPNTNVIPLVYQADRLVTDINVEFRLTDRLTLFLDGRNILNEPSVYTYFGREENFERILHTGGIWMLGVKGRF